MNTIDNELTKNGIHVVGPIDQNSINDISMYVAKTLYYKFPDLKLNYNTVYSRIASLKMYIADMTTNSGACYYYKNNSIYFVCLSLTRIFASDKGKSNWNVYEEDFDFSCGNVGADNGLCPG